MSHESDSSDGRDGSESVAPRRKPLVIGIGGGTGAGKTTISRAVMAELTDQTAAYLQHDSYYRDRPELTPDQRARLNYDHPDSLDNDLLVEHLDALIASQPVEAPIYDFVTHRRKVETQHIDPAPVVIVEGILIFADPRLNARYDIKLYVDTPPDIRVLRRIRRDIEQRGRTFDDVRRQYYATVRPMHYSFVEPTKYHADLIIPEGGNTRVAIDLIVRRVRQEATSRRPSTPR
jgi:uridine kinase